VLDDTATAGRVLPPGLLSREHDFEFETAGGTPFGLELHRRRDPADVCVLRQDVVHTARRRPQGTLDSSNLWWDISFSNSNIKTSYDLIVNPAVTAKVGFHSPVRTLQAVFL